jgi:hypothetical protein
MLTYQRMLEWIKDHQGLLWIAGAASIAVFIASILLIPALVVRIRPDYFTHDERPPSPWADLHPILRVAIIAAKNLLGGILILAGIAMLLLPGQGLLTLLVGFFLIDFPRKYSLEKWLMSRKQVRRPINWLRKRHRRPPLQVSQTASENLNRSQ